MLNFTLLKPKAALLVIDVQEKLFGHVERSCEVLHSLLKVVRGAQLLGIPIYATEQYPHGLGPTLAPLRELLGPEQTYLDKTCFSCLGDPGIKEHLLKEPVSQWILVGIEAHVCVLQTAKDLRAAGKEVTVLNDAIASRSIYDFSTAIAEMRDCGVRISSVETILFELVRDAKAPEFKAISQLVK